MPTPADILKTYWGYDGFRPLQEEIIQAVVDGQDTLALLPTGGGKSICYQVPALMQEGICLVVSPLIALMKDQVEGLKGRGVMALALYSGMSRRQMVQTLKNASYGPYKLLYVSPERLGTDLFKEYLPSLGVNLIAVDEAHCISQWGYDFRPAYLKIAELRAELTQVPVLALTASATPEVQTDICDKLGFRNGQIFRQSFIRKNLSYSVFNPEAKSSKLVSIVQKVPGSGLVYCKSRRRTVEVAHLLQMHGIKAAFYHAGLKAEERNQRQQDWIEGKIAVMVCTNAFGMGIDKSNVRLVVHVDIPDSIEAYYQEAGRAGRDGKKAYAVLLHNSKDNDALGQLHVTRFPSFESIKSCYSALVNFLQIPAYSGEDVTYEFRFDDWVKRFHLNATEALYALKALEADGWLQFNEQAFTPSTVEFTTTKKELRAFQDANQALEPLLTTLLRTYEGIFDHPTFISEKLVAKLLRISEEDIKKALEQASRFGIISYKPQTDTPQIIFRKQRVPVEDLKVDLTGYNKRKEAFIKRVEKVIQYTTASGCRSGFINSYFGDPTLPCGVCDTCLARKKTAFTPEEFNLIQKQFTAQLLKGPTKAEDLVSPLHKTQQEKGWQVLRFLQSEGAIKTDETGTLHLKKATAGPASAGGTTQA